MNKLITSDIEESEVIVAWGKQDDINTGISIRMFYTIHDKWVVWQEINGSEVVRMTLQDIDLDGLIEFFQKAKKEKEMKDVCKKLRGN